MVLVNDSGEQIVATSGDDVEAVLPGKSAELPAAGGKLVIDTAKCRYKYVLPQSAGLDPKPADQRLGLQMEPGANLYTIPPASLSPVTRSDLEKSRANGFPLAPQETSCH